MVSHMVHDVTAIEAPVAARPILDHLLQLYLHDFSELAPLGSPFGEVNHNGLFDYKAGLDSYWREPSRVPLLIRADGRIAGFVLLSQWSALDHPLDRAVAEFFVLRKYRLASIGTRTAHQLFRRYPGCWEVPVADYNPGALRFWRSVVHSLGATEHAGDGQRWSGPVLCFETGSAA
jgi:predicted acetyltransferase